LSLKQKALTGVKWTTASTIVTTLAQLLQISILAHLLNPSDFGLMAIVMVVIGFSHAFLDMGISNAIIHKQEITHEQLSTLYWVNVLAGCLLFLLISILAPFIANFYHETELTRLIILVAITFLIQPFGQQFMILLEKELSFDKIAKVQMSTKILSLLVSVGFAYFGYGVYSIVYGLLAAIILQTILFLNIGIREHKPSIVFKWNQITDFINFGMYQMGERTINYFNYQIDTILIGKFLGSEALGIYSIAKELIMRPAQILNPIVTRVTFPTMAKIQNDTLQLKNIYLKTINYLSSISFPIYALMIVLSPEIILILFGEKWIEAIPILQILSIYGALRSTANPIGSLLLAKGKARLGFYWNLGMFLFIPIVIYVSSHWGLMGIAWGWVSISIIFIIPSWYFLVKPLCKAKFVEYHWQILKPMLISICLIIVSYYISICVDNIILKVCLVSSIGGAFVLLLNWVFNQSFLIKIMELVNIQLSNRPKVF
jgi:O-antigen/teichoic acid export membrane protein